MSDQGNCPYDLNDVAKVTRSKVDKTASRSSVDALHRKISGLRAEITQRDQVIARLQQEIAELKQDKSQ